MKKLILLSVLPILFLTACQEQNSEQTNEQNKAALMKVNVVQVQPATLTQTLRLSGSITAKEDVAVGTALLGLQIQTVNVEVGDVVKKGQVLATLETSNVQSQLRQNDANLQRAKANLVSQQSALTEAEATLKRYQTLMKSGCHKPSGIGATTGESPCRSCSGSGGECGNRSGTGTA